MARYKFFNSRIEPMCQYCRNGRHSGAKTLILCERYGIVDGGFSCKRFLYDPLKRIPFRQNILPKFDKSDFEL